MLSIDIIVPLVSPRLWHELVVTRLRADGHDVAVLHDPAAKPWPRTVRTILSLERRLLRRAERGLDFPLESIPGSGGERVPALRLDLAGHATGSDIPTISLRFGQAPIDLPAVLSVVGGGLPGIEAILDGRTIVGRASPMIDRWEAASLGIEDVFARAVTLLVSVVRPFAEGRLASMGSACDPADGGGDGAARFISTYLSGALPRLGREAIRRARFHQAHWRVGYRFIEGPGVAETGRLGTGWTVLPDAGDRFYADPFPFHWRGCPFIFVEDYAHAIGKAVISVVPLDANGAQGKPQVVLEEPHHLSYPQVFARNGSVWMLPEASASGKLTLYRATRFPDRWTAEAVLLEGEISDATLLEHGGSLWLFATLRDGYGSTSDTLVVFQAPALTGPWRPHRLNPVLIDRRRARPGGAFVQNGEGRVVLPVQDGTLGYGGGLGLSELLLLDEQAVHLSEPRPILADGDWPYPRIHTLNRSGPLEVIDGIAAVPKRSSGNRAS